ncbi:GAF domain-containing protein [bacterium]|nr:MAG: GAF domain-containing protein [bacterium]
MTGFSFSSLRVRLVLLVLFAVIPALGLILYTASEQRRAAAGEAQANALRLAQSVSSTQDDLFEGARQLLIALAQVPMVRGDNPAECNSLFSVLVKKYASYTNLGVVTPAGDIFCSGLPLPGPVNVADRAWFRRALESRDLVIGDYIVGRVTGKATLGLGYPVLDEAGAVRAVLYAGLDLGWLNKIAAKTQLPTGTTLTVIDRKGTILVRFPESEKWVGKSMPETLLVQTILRQGEGTAELPGMDGVPRLYGFSPLGKPGDAYVSIGVPKSVAFATANRILTRNLMGVGIVSALAFLAAWFGADLFVLRQVHALIGIAKRLSGEELGVRTGLSYGQGELGELARVFDQMAEGLQTRQAGAKRAEEQIQLQLQRITALREINLATTSTLDLHAALNVLMEKIDLFLPYTAVLVWLKNRESGQLERAACWNLDEEDWKGRPLNRTPLLVQAAIESKASVVASNVQTDPRTLDPELYRRHGLVSYLGVPLIVKDEALGVLVFLTREEHQFTDEEIEFLSTLAGQAAIAIYNSQLHEQTKIQAAELQRANQDLTRKKEIQELLKELSQEITSLDIDSLLKKLTEKVREILRVDVSDVRIGEREVWQVVGVSGIEPNLLNPPGSATVRGLSSWTLEHRRPLMIQDVTKTDLPTGTTLKNLGLHGYLGVPLFSRSGEVMGILRALTYQPREFTQEEVDLLQQMASGSAIALENARLLEHIKNQAVELEKANKVKDEFLGFVSHELKTPVNAVLGYAEMIQERLFGEINPEQVRALGKVIGCSRDLINMINSLLQATQIEAGVVKVEREEVALANLLDDLRSIYSVPLGKELTLNWDYPSEFPAIKTDREKLRHVLQNLISNAIKYTDKGNVSISARWLPEAKVVEFRVADTGIGIPGESLPFVFEMFRQVEGSKNGSRGGVGLGLHIVKKFTNLLGGKIDVESEPGRGSTFTVTIPCGHEATGERQ